ncbi:MAG: response regulator transcription factor [Saprospiraceae bacterium]|nr:response regulator transcription factor [Saprospiraceae bacterium]
MSETRILYVEDEPFLGKIVKESLERRGYFVQMIDDGNKALQVFRDLNPDICLLDVMLPGKDGFSIGGEIKELQPTMPIIFLTAKSQTKDIVKGFNSGGNDFIKKPFSMEELVVRIENLLNLQNQKSRHHAPEYYNIRSFRFNPSLLELTSTQQTIKLSNRENELLKLLVQHAHHSIDRRKILNEIWGDDHFFNSRNLDVYITKLRRYFKEDPNIQIITLKGIGYRFVY